MELKTFRFWVRMFFDLYAKWQYVWFMQIVVENNKLTLRLQILCLVVPVHFKRTPSIPLLHVLQDESMVLWSKSSKKYLGIDLIQ